MGILKVIRHQVISPRKLIFTCTRVQMRFYIDGNQNVPNLGILNAAEDLKMKENESGL